MFKCKCKKNLKLALSSHRLVGTKFSLLTIKCRRSNIHCFQLTVQVVPEYPEAQAQVYPAATVLDKEQTPPF